MKKSILIDEEIHQKLKVYCASNGYKMKEWLEQAICENMRNNRGLSKDIQSTNRKSKK